MPENAGLYRKFNVTRTDGRDQPGGDREDAVYFTFDITNDPYAISGLLGYAAGCEHDLPELARCLRELARELRAGQPGPTAGGGLMSDSLLPELLMVAVPLRMAAFKAMGGPSAEHISWARSFASVLAEEADTLQYGGYKGKQKGRAARLFNDLAQALAIMSFCPGGVCFCGTRYDASQTRMGEPRLTYGPIDLPEEAP